MNTPTVGRIVHYTPTVDQLEMFNGATVLPAIIVKVNDEANGIVNLKVFNNGHADRFLKDMYQAAEPTPGGWHWPVKN